MSIRGLSHPALLRAAIRGIVAYRVWPRMTGRCAWLMLIAMLELVVAVSRVSAEPATNITGKWVGEWIEGLNPFNPFRGRLEVQLSQASDGTLSGGLVAYDRFTDPNGVASSAVVSGLLRPNRTATLQAVFGIPEFTAVFNGTFGSDGEASGTYTNFNLHNDDGTWSLRLVRGLSNTTCLPFLDFPFPSVSCETLPGSAPSLRQTLVTKDFPSGPRMSVGGVAGAQANFGELRGLATINLQDARPFFNYLSATPADIIFASFPFTSWAEASARDTLRVATANAQGAGKLELKFRITGQSGFQVTSFVDPQGNHLVGADLSSQMVVNDQNQFLFCCNPPPVGPVDVSLKFVVPFVFADPLVLDTSLLVAADPYIASFAFLDGFVGYVEAVRLSASQGIDLRNTAVLENLLVTDADGTPIPGVTVTSESGTIYPLDPANGSADSFAPTTSALLSPSPNVSGWNKTDVAVGLTAIDNEGGSGVKEIAVALNGSQTGSFLQSGSNARIVVSAEGVTTLTYFARDHAGNQEAAKTIVVRVDKTSPVIAGLPAAGCTLWPPNHRLAEVATVTARDTVSGIVPGSFAVTGISNEPENGLGDGDTAPDIVISNGRIQLRAERSGSGPGRVYNLTATASDLAGNVATATSACTVPP
jgi:hypothetical protein